ncbi:ABC transporter ATP-binding protein [Anabaena sp. FACHB-709]|uniref:ABC transporter ATP-binding protein n=2 Tax=Nostocaceae TaxID=1162 RepID=A0A1Z4KP66_ANAVA|nr:MULTISPECIES: ABC transporter ATP-binding protein [Nostocaceae]BAY70791.1 ABC transporter ATP-binding protein [Trichormus variabilis NIES-23]HBW33817.1 ABC transporter ATP-binding protein [Nostoc sp. UBA8866]MBD2171200.1 ABC transporter ATP-binding protein [Anabaena cylindrica FACHB-318]MBD2263130.1 ABC transporter ATP-binding protein [Anabaena sp. FACHB-709]MBD2272527.1 ABC transporter ATP-binding protein [Nostoc sp. PCC 7120 = FACHB-418]
MLKPKKSAVPGLWGVLAYFWPDIRPQYGLLLVSAIALIADVGLRVLEPWPLKFVFDYVLLRGERLNTVPLIANLEPITLLTFSAVAVLIITGLRALAAYGSTVGLAIVGSRVMAKVRNRLYCHLQNLSLAYHTKARSGDLIIRVSSDASRLQEIMITAALPLVVSILSLFGMIGVMFWMNRSLTLLSLITLPFFWLVTNRLSQRIKDSSLKQRQQEGAVAATAAESIAAIKLVKALSLQDAFARVFAQQNQSSLKESVKTQRLAAHLERTVDGVIAMGTAIILWYGSWLALRDALTPGDVLVFLTYLKNAFKPVQNLAKYTGRLAKAAASGERILDVLNQKPDISDSPEAFPAPIFRGAVRFDRVHFAYNSGRVLLEDINLNIQSGQQVAIVGTSGGGKSTLVSLLLRLYDPTSGRVMIDGRDIREYTLASFRSQISVVLQDSLLFAASIKENIAYGIAGVSDAEIEEAARLAHAHDFIQALPQGYDTLVGERGSTLSGGQRQRIAIARAAIRQAPILILDEPTTGLDKESEKAVIDALQRLSANRTTFLITHDLDFATRADMIIYLENGRIAEQGSHLELMRKHGRYAALYEVQASLRV